jgi:filamin
MEDYSNMSSGDKHLDAEWKRIQKKTFTRWCNEHLKVQDMMVEDLSTDLSDGVRLIVLIEVLSHKKVGRYNKKPRVFAQKMENVQLALDFLMKKERIRLVNIGSGDIVDQNLKLILGLIWTLILHYQISMGFGIGDDKDHGGLTPKQALIAYLQVTNAILWTITP